MNISNKRWLDYPPTSLFCRKYEVRLSCMGLYVLIYTRLYALIRAYTCLYALIRAYTRLSLILISVLSHF